MKIQSQNLATRSVVLLIAFMLVGCAARGVVYQNATIDALLDGNYDGEMTMSQMLRHGDFGLGTFDHLDGEMLVLGGRVYQVRSNGSVHVAPAEITAPFAAVTFFHSERKIALDAMSYAGLQQRLDTMRPADGHAYAFLVRGKFASVRTRSVPRQNPPYRRLAEVVKQQAVFDLKDCDGTLVGFWFPESMRHINVPGYHFHFITADQKAGGHVLDLGLKHGRAEVQSLSSIRLDLSARAPRVVSPTTQSNELEAVEK